MIMQILFKNGIKLINHFAKLQKGLGNPDEWHLMYDNEALCNISSLFVHCYKKWFIRT